MPGACRDPRGASAGRGGVDRGVLHVDDGAHRDARHRAGEQQPQADGHRGSGDDDQQLAFEQALLAHDGGGQRPERVAESGAQHRRYVRAPFNREIDVVMFTSANQVMNLVQVATSMQLQDVIRGAFSRVVIASIVAFWIGDFVNAATADVVELVAKHEFDSFKVNTDKLNARYYSEEGMELIERATLKEIPARAARPATIS